MIEQTSSNNFPEIRDAIRSLCAEFPDEYFRKVDEARAYPEQFVDALNEGLVANHTEAEMAQLKARIQSFSETMLTIGEAKTGMRLDLDWLPGNGLRLSVAGQVRGKLIEGEDFYRALLRVWLGEKPVQADLKQALLGKGQ